VFIKLSLIIGAVDLWMSECCVFAFETKQPRSAHTQMRAFEVRARTKTKNNSPLIHPPADGAEIASLLLFSLRVV
jgi:hypothetical protein